MCICMSSKTISIKESAYNRLKALKGRDKSFSDVILDLTEDTTNDFSNIIGEGIDISTDELEDMRNRSEDEDERESLLRRH